VPEREKGNGGERKRNQGWRGEKGDRENVITIIIFGILKK